MVQLTDIHPLTDFLRNARWFGAKARTIHQLQSMGYAVTLERAS